MIYTYLVTGMIRNGCKTGVENYLKSVLEIDEVSADLESKKATFIVNTIMIIMTIFMLIKITVG